MDLRARQRQAQQEREAAFERRVDDLAAKLRLPALEGAPQQIAWAEQIRQPLHRQIANEYIYWQDQPEDICRTRKMQMLVALVRQVSAAKWIERAREYRAAERILTARTGPDPRINYGEPPLPQNLAAHDHANRPNLLACAMNAAADFCSAAYYLKGGEGEGCEIASFLLLRLGPGGERCAIALICTVFCGRVRLVAMLSP